MDLFPSSGEGLGSLEKANLNHWAIALSKGLNRVGVFFLSLHLKKKRDPFSETLCFLVTASVV
jgi:hypothetical protein